MRQQNFPSLSQRYGVAVLSIALAIGVRWVLMPIIGVSVPFMQFFPAIALSAWYGGLGPGLAATILSALCVDYFLIPPFQSVLSANASDGFSLIMFIVIGILLSVLNESLHRAGRQISETATRLNETNEHFHLLVESVRDYAIFTLDPKGHVVSWNSGAQRIKGYTADEIIGQQFSCFFTAEDCQIGKPEEKLRRAASEGHFEYEGWCVRKDRTRFWANVVLTPMRNEAGELRAYANITRDITELKRTQEELREREQRLQAVLDNTAISVYIKDTEGRYLFVSRGFEQAYGRQRSEILGRTDFDMCAPQFAESFRAHDQRILKLSEPIVIEEDIKTYDGKPVTYLSSKFPLRNAKGEAYAVCGISTDITERKQAEQRISQLLTQEQAARAEAEAASRAKDEFLSVLSHELRTPLTSILGWISLLRSSRLDGDMAAQALQTIERNAQIQANLIEDLLDVSRIISGKLSIEPQIFDLATAAIAALNSIKPAADTKGIELQLDAPSIAVVADQNRMQQVIANLLSNAVKFTPKNGRVSLQLLPLDSHVKIIVKDSGQGISPQFLPQVFDHFRQADSSSTRGHGGLGLGLAIVRYIVQEHGGTITAHSSGAGQGSTFTVQIPKSISPYVEVQNPLSKQRAE